MQCVYKRDPFIESMDHGPKRHPAVLVLGLGNVLMRDDGVGIYTVHKLRELSLPTEVGLIEGDCLWLDLFEYFDQYQTIIIIDAVDAGKDPGTVMVLQPTQILEGRGGTVYSFHDIDIGIVLSLYKLMRDRLPDLVIIGIQPKEVTMGTGLSPEVERGVNEIIDMVTARIAIIATVENCPG